MNIKSQGQAAQYDYSLLTSIGNDVFISGNVEIRRPHLVSIGNHVAIDTGFYLTTSANIGDYVHIAPYVTVIGGEQGNLIMEHFSGVSAGCRIICGSDDYLGDGLTGPTIPEKYHAAIKYAPVVLEKFVVLGTNVVVMPGVRIGEGSVIGACSLVTKDVEPWSVYVGTPARKVKDRPKDKIIAYAREMGYL